MKKNKKNKKIYKKILTYKGLFGMIILDRGKGINLSRKYITIAGYQHSYGGWDEVARNPKQYKAHKEAKKKKMREIVYGQLMELGFTGAQADDIIAAMDLEEEE